MLNPELFLNIFGIIIAILVLSILVAVHELGHLLMAKWCNVRVDVFSIGMGKSIWGFQYGETYYQIGRLPFGGFCGFGNEENADDPDPRALMNSPLWARLLTIIGGSLFNIIFAYLVMVIMFGIGFKEYHLSNQVYVPTQIVSPQDQSLIDSPAYTAGLRSGDFIIQINDKSINHFMDIPVALSSSTEATKIVYYVRDNLTNQVPVTTIPDFATGLDLIGVQPVSPAIISKVLDDSPARQAGFIVGDQIIAINSTPIQFFHSVVEKVQEGKPLSFTIVRNEQTNTISIQNNVLQQIGIQAEYPQQIQILRKASSFGSAFSMATENITSIISQIKASLVKLFSGQVNVQQNLSGPVRIISITGDIVKTFDGALLVKFMVMLSLALAIFNLLPFPGLDGGHIILNTARSIFKNNPLVEKIITVIEQAGIILLLTVAVFVLFNDIKNIAKENTQTQQTKE
ncbi:MAG: RIP metalloprotease RseP [Brevinema sp.]